jgi:hypothetical protein
MEICLCICIRQILLALQMPSGENSTSTKKFCIRQHVAAVEILSELRSQETFGWNFFLCLKFLGSFCMYCLPMKEEEL